MASTSALKRLLMCPPKYFKVMYHINPWMVDTVGPVDTDKAMSQWTNLKSTLEKCGASVSVMDPKGAEFLPDIVFTANAAIVRAKRVYLANFFYPERKGERILYERWFRDNGYETCGDIYMAHEGAGDALFQDEHRLFCGTGFRSDPNSIPVIQEELSAVDQTPIKTFVFNLIDPRFYHIDTCFCPLGDRLSLWYPGAFDDKARQLMKSQVEELLPVDEDEAMQFACNAVVVGKNVVLPEGNDKTARMLEKNGFVPHPVNVTEFLKSGGACKCLTLHI